MGKVGKAIGVGIFIGVITIATAGIGTGVLSALTAQVGSLGAAVGIGLSATIAGGIAGGLIAGGLLLASSVLTPGLSDIQEQSGQKVPITNPLDTRKIIYGDGTLIAGTEMFIEEYDSNGADDVPNDTVVFARIVSDRPVAGFGDFYLGDKVVSFDGSGNATGTYNGKLFLKTYDGTQTAADPWLMAAHVDWNATAIGAGQAYYVVKAIFDPEVFPYGLGELRGCAIEVLQGAPVYDPRLDSTNGGSGTHRLADASTWRFSANPALTIYDFMRDVVLGNPVPDDEIDLDALITAANICDEDVAVNGGGTIKRYSLGGVVDCRKSKLANIDLMLSAMGGRRTWLGGKIQLFAAGPVAQTISLAENDVVTLDYIDLIATDQRINEVRASYIDASDRYNQAEAPAYVDAVAQASEGVKTLPLNLPFTQDHRVAQRLAKLVGLEARLPMINVTAMPIAAALAPMHVAGITCPDVELVDEAYRVTKHSIDTSSNSPLGVNMEMVREDASVHAWDAATDEKAPESSGQLVQATGLATITPGGVTVTPGLITSGDGLETTVLEVSWNSPGPLIANTIIDYRLNGATPWTPGGVSIRGDNDHVLILPHNLAYDVRVRHTLINGTITAEIIVLNTTTSTTAAHITNTNQITDGAGLGTSAQWASVSGRGKIAAAINESATGATDNKRVRFFGFSTDGNYPDRTIKATIVKPDGSDFTWGSTAVSQSAYSGNGSNGVYYLVLDISGGVRFGHIGTNDSKVGVCKNLGATTLEYFKATIGWASLAHDANMIVFGFVERRAGKFVHAGLFEPTAIADAPSVFSLVGIESPEHLPIESVAGVYTLDPSAPCTGFDNGASARIDVAATDVYYGASTLHFNSGSVTGLSFSTAYWVYAVDDNFVGGSVTYVATTDRTSFPENAVYFGQCTTPANGAASTTAFQGGYAGLGGARDNTFTEPL